MSSTAIVSAKGWVVIPKELRERYGIKKGTRIRFVDYGGSISLVPEVAEEDPIETLYGMLADGPSLTEALLKEHAEEVEREEEELDHYLRAG
jgi:AbrB family looped-hinge helix DNA binding protein